MRCDSGQACGLGTVGAVFNVMNTIKSQDGGGGCKAIFSFKKFR